MKFALYANVAMSPCDMIERMMLEADNNFTFITNHAELVNDSQSPALYNLKLKAGRKKSPRNNK